MTTLAQLTTDTLNLLYGMESIERPAEDTLAADLLTAGTSATPTTPTMWFKNDYAEFEDGDLIVFAADSAGATTVRRSQRGSTASDHSNGDPMLKNPLFPRIEVEKHVQRTIRSRLWPHVWTWHRDSLAAVSTDTMYDLDQYIEDVVEVYQENLAGEEAFHPIPNGWWDVERQINSAVATQGAMLRLRKVYDYDETVYFTAKRRPHVDDLANLSDEIADMVPFCAAGLAILARSPQLKNDAARSRRDDGGLARDYRGLMTEFFQQRDEYGRQLHFEVRPEPKFRKRFRRRW